MERTDKSVDGFLESLEGIQGDDMRTLDGEISKHIAGRPRTLYEGKFWGGTDQSIIGYGDLDYTNSRGGVVEWFLVGLAAQKNYISVYVNATDEDGYLVAKYAGRLGKAKVKSAAITFKTVDGLDLEVLMELVDKVGRAEQDQS